jgi:Tol biopolymer transport system component
VTTDRWQRVKRLFEAAVDKPEAERPTFLATAVAGDEALRQEVEALLAADDAATGLLERWPLASESLIAELQNAFGQIRTDAPSSPGVIVGNRLGNYAVIAPLGAGGMGEVYRARDPRLGRDVAIKILPRAFTTDPERLARFEREARVLASLNHPHIAAIYGIEETGTAPALVLELVDGPTLAERIKGGRLTIDEALTMGRQIADALAAAHDKGIVHRDLKPANVKLTSSGAVKVLDFGLAKALVGDGAGSDVTESPTVATAATRAGVIAGTVGYMSPEQARGKPVDRRTDIWAFGCVLYEMLTGRLAFSRETASDTIAAILEREPDWRALPSGTPSSILRLLERCLDKDAGRRLRDIGDARIELDDALADRRRPDRAAARTAAWWLAGIAAVVIVGVGLYAWRAVAGREPGKITEPRVGPSQWVQLTRLADPVSQPALSSDGRMLTFVRGAGTFATGGDIFIKMLPDGEAVQLTHDGSMKDSPVFSPDSSQIAYTQVISNAQYDTWMVSINGGQPHLWLPNVSGLVWLDHRRILFSEIKNGDIHMAIVTAEESRAGERDVYVPAGDRDMAHRSYPSPDRKWAIVAEMTRGVWQPCRVVPMDGSAPGRQVGPPSAECLSAAWSSDGNWMYVSSAAGGAFHIWRQHFPDGSPEQVTSGPTEEEGIAMAPDGKSFITAVGLRESAVWLHDASGERPVSGEGYACDPRFTADGRKLLYRILKGVSPYDPGELRIFDLQSGRTEVALPGLDIIGWPGRAYDVSVDGGQVVVATRDGKGRPRLWLAPLDHRTPPQQIPNVDGSQPFFASGGEVVFWRTDGASAFAYRVHQDGTGLQKVTEAPLASLAGVSFDGTWLLARSPGTAGPSIVALPLRGGSLVPFASGDASEGLVKWSADRRSIFISVVPTLSPGAGASYAIPLGLGRVFPPVPSGGFASAAAIGKLPGARMIASTDVAPGPTIDVYAYVRQTVQRNLYRIPTP